MSISYGGNNITFPDASTQNTSPKTGFVNRIINGGMTIDQRNAGASVTPTSQQYALDRWVCGLTQASKYTVQQNAGAVTPPAGFTNYSGITSTSAYSVTSGDIFYYEQRIEGFNVADLGFGTANAQPITLSFQVRSSLTGTFGGALRNTNNNLSYPFNYSIPVANTWTQISVVIAGPTTGTWNTTNGVGLRVTFGLGGGSTYSGTAGSWSASEFYTATGSTSVVGTSGATFYITGVQLEKGSTSTPFEFRSIGQEEMLCQRYYQSYTINVYQYGLSSDFASTYVTLGTSMRVAPTASRSGGSFSNCTFAAVENILANSFRYTVQLVSTGMASVSSDKINLPAEL